VQGKERGLGVCTFVVLLLLALHPRPRLMSQTDTLYADLDHRAGNEMVVLTHNRISASDTTARIRLYRRRDQVWKPWGAATGAALIAEEDKLAVWFERGALVISRSFGNWNYRSLIHRYRFQDGRFKLISLTQTHGERFGLAETLDYNLSTGEYTYEERSFADLDADDKEEDSPKTLHSFRGRKWPAHQFYLGDADLPRGRLEVEGRPDVVF